MPYGDLEVTAYSGLGPGIHEVTVTGLEQKTSKAGGPYLRWEFTGDNGQTASAASSVEMTPGNKTGKWFSALTGRPTVIGEKRNITEVTGKRATIVLALNAEGYPKVETLVASQQAPATSPVRPLETTEAAPTPAADASSTPDELPF